MALKGIATQAELATFQDVLGQLASNLYFHINETDGSVLGSTLSQAHGLDVVVGYVDSYGNDLRIYADSNGDRVSDAYSTGKANFVRFVINGQPYYAPLQTSSADPQPASTGITTSSTTATSTPGSCVLITDYVTDEAAKAANLDNLLLEHTRAPSQLAHIPLTVVPTATLDSAGHTVGTHIVYLQFKQIVYGIPVSNRLGGPAQTIKGINLVSTLSTKLNGVYAAHDDDQNATFYVTTATGGTLPYTIIYQINRDRTGLDPIWVDMTDTAPGPHDCGVIDTMKYNISTPNILYLQSFIGGDSRVQAAVARLKIIAGDGITISYSNYAVMDGADMDGSWIFGGPGSKYETFYRYITGSPPIQ